MSIAGIISIVRCQLSVIRWGTIYRASTDDELLTCRPGYEICQQLKPPAPALLGVKLYCGQIVAYERAWEHGPIVGLTGGDLLVGEVAVERVNEVEVAAVGNAGKQRVIARAGAVVYLVPSDLWDLLPFGKPPDAPAKDAQTGMWPKLLALVAEYLHPHTDAEKRLACANDLADRLIHT